MATNSQDMANARQKHCNCKDTAHTSQRLWQNHGKGMAKTPQKHGNKNNRHMSTPWDEHGKRIKQALQWHDNIKAQGMGKATHNRCIDACHAFLFQCEAVLRVLPSCDARTCLYYHSAGCPWLPPVKRTPMRPLRCGNGSEGCSI
jgi:hypothetical protein